MANITVTGNQAYFNEDAKFFKDVYIYGTLYYDFESFPGVLKFRDIAVSGSATFNGKSTFNDDSLFNAPVIIKNLSVTESLNVSGNSGFSGITTFYNQVYFTLPVTIPDLTVTENLRSLGISTFGGTSTFYGDVYTEEDLFATRLYVSDYFGVGDDNAVLNADNITKKVGIGSTSPEQKLDVSGSVKIDQFIYDSANSPGDNNYFLRRDEFGIRWVAITPSITEGIYIQDEGQFIPTVGAAQSFNTINFVQRNSLGLGTDTLIPTAANDNSQTGLATVFTQDLWGFSGSGDNASIYRMTNVGIGIENPSDTLDITGTLHVTGAVDFDSTLNVGDITIIESTVGSTDSTDGALQVKGGVGIVERLNVGDITIIESEEDSIDKDTGALQVKGGVGIVERLNVGGITIIESEEDSIDKDTGALQVKGGAGIGKSLNVGNKLAVTSSTTLNDTLTVIGISSFTNNTQSTSKDTGAVTVKGGVGIGSTLTVGGNAKIEGALELESSLIDINNSTATGKFDYRLSSIGTGVSWRPPGVQTQNAIWVTMDGNDANTGFLEGDAKRTIGAAASIAEEGDTIFVRSGVYFENNPIGLRTDVSVSGQDLRLVTIIPQNRNKDVFQVRRGCLVENLSFAGVNVSIAHTGIGAIAFPPTIQDINAGIESGASTGYLAPGPATEGSSGRWKSPYIRNCTNFMTKSIGMKINGDYAVSSTIGADLKCMVCDSFTQYNENGIGVSLSNNAYAQLVSIFTINCDIGIYAESGGSCDLTNSNSSFGNFGLYAVGLGRTEFTGQVGKYPSFRTQPGVDAGSDIVNFVNIADEFANPRRPFDGQALFFEINLDNYPDAQGTGILQEPMVDVLEVKVLNGGSGFSAANPPTVIIRDLTDQTQQPKGPQGIIAEVSPTIDPETGAITAIDVVNSGRNYLPTQQLEVFIDGGNLVGAAATVITRPIYYTVDAATEPTIPSVGITNAAYLIEKNIDFIAAEAMDRTYYNFSGFSVPGLGTSRCITDIKIILKAINYNIVFGGNDRVYDAAKFYAENPVLEGEEEESIYAYNSIVGIITNIIRNQTVNPISEINNTFTQFIDNSAVVGLTTAQNIDSNVSIFVGIITTGIGASTLLPSIPRTIGNTVGVTNVTFNQFIPYELFGGEEISLKRISRILTSSHSFEYIGTGVDINTSTPFKGAVPIKANEVVALDGAQVPFTSTDQKGNFDIGEGFQINQPTATISGRDFSKAIQAEVTPLILALR